LKVIFINDLKSNFFSKIGGHSLYLIFPKIKPNEQPPKTESQAIILF